MHLLQPNRHIIIAAVFIQNIGNSRTHLEIIGIVASIACGNNNNNNLLEKKNSSTRR